MWVALLALMLGVVAVVCVRSGMHRHKTTVVAGASASQGAWNALGGQWRFTTDEIQNGTDERGAKLINNTIAGENYTVAADLRMQGERGDMGLILRSSYEKPGLDTYVGYYVGLRATDGTIVIGRSDYAWIEARPMPMPGGIHASVWYRLRATAFGCNVAASAENLQTGQKAWIAFQDTSCLKKGRVGLRSVDTAGTWRNINIAPARWSDYLEVRQHASAVVSPIVPDGPPWWTPGRAGLCFAGVLLLVLLGQFMYFRVQHWKRLAISQERERLAHAIHDTMAQSFAGIGYQLQGIRNSVLRSDGEEAALLADQLTVAYQLVRRCHEDASRTIAMLGSRSPLTPQKLLEELAATAYKIAGDRIRTLTKMQGTPGNLDLRVADALLHIGQEAISNAISHADPTAITVALQFEERDVVLLIEDNGCGFDQTPERKGFGIFGMEKRAREIAARFTIRGRVHGGCQVTVRAAFRHHGFRLRLAPALSVLGLQRPSETTTQ